MISKIFKIHKKLPENHDKDFQAAFKLKRQISSLIDRFSVHPLLQLQPY